MKKGFTFLEMMVVIGILVLLMGMTAVGYSHIAERAQRVKTQETVSNAATALTLIFQDNKFWPKSIRDGHGQHKLTAQVCNAFVRHGNGLLGISYKKSEDANGIVSRVVDDKSADRFGLVDSWAQAIIRRNKNVQASTTVSGGGTIDDHVLRFAVDLDGDGITELPGGVKVRATACVWSVGKDGKDDVSTGGSRTRSDDIYSWNQNQETEMK